MFRHILGRNPLGHTFFAADNGANGSGGNSNNPEAKKDANNSSESEVVKLLNAILGSQRVGGDMGKAGEVLAGQILAKDRKIADLEAKVGKLPDDVQTELDSYRALGKPDELKTRVENGDAAIADKAQREANDARDAAVKAAGFDPEKFGVLAFANEYSYEKVKETRDGKEVEVAYASREVNGKTERKSVEDVVKERAASMADVLKAGTSSTQSTVTSYPKGAPLGGGQPTTIWDKIREEKKPVTDEAPKSWQEQIGLK